jgi:RNA polymerase sigma factor (sigma-70 family)
MSVFRVSGHKQVEADMDDLELLHQYAFAGSEDAFAALVSRHVDMVYSVALRRVGNPEAAQEIAQAVFIILARKSRKLSSGTILPAWLHQTTRLTAAHWVRTEMRRAHREQEAYMQSLTNAPRPDVWEQVAPLLDDAIAGLGEKDRNAIVIRFFQGGNLAQVGASLGTSEDAAHKRVNRAVEKLRNYFVKRGIAVSAGALVTAISANSVHAAPGGLASIIAATAAVKGAITAAPTLTLIKGTLKIMAWTKLKAGLVGASALILAFGAGRMAAMRSADYFAGHAPKVSTTTNAPVVAGSVRPASGPGFRWENIESSDYRQYIANMRAAGIPEPVIRDIVIADVVKNYALRIQKLLPSGETRPYWQKQKPQVQYSGQTSQQKKIMAVVKEEAAVIESLLGQKFSVQKLFDQMYLQANSLDVSVAWLPPEKRDAALRMFNETGFHDLEIEFHEYDDWASNFARRLDVLKGILTPAELEEYKLRQSPEAFEFRNQEGRYADLTLDEYKALLQVRSQRGKNSLGDTAQSLREQTQALAKLVGQGRAREIVLKSDKAYYWMRQAVERYDLPIEAADQALKLKTDTESAYVKILTDPSLSKSEQEQRFNAVQAAAREAFVACLGTNAAKVAYRGGNSWLFSDRDHYSFQLKSRP